MTERLTEIHEHADGSIIVKFPAGFWQEIREHLQEGVVMRFKRNAVSAHTQKGKLIDRLKTTGTNEQK